MASDLAATVPLCPSPNPDQSNSAQTEAVGTFPLFVDFLLLLCQMDWWITKELVNPPWPQEINLSRQLAVHSVGFYRRFPKLPSWDPEHSSACALGLYPFYTIVVCRSLNRNKHGELGNVWKFLILLNCLTRWYHLKAMVYKYLQSASIRQVI